uniref:Conserved hypothetical plastid protein n=1 Tax=Triparma laevis TaxID=1534972 RepID=A0A0K2RWW8_9STRA|nr:conserved hypothetical plastid protein [Triparma laevis]BAS19092.1 conserved hypothetical plastid protein [Triparma laevis]
MSLLIVGGTGTLGRQIVRQALNEGYQVRCLVRNIRKATFLKEWGAELVYGDLSLPETIPPCLIGITSVIDASTSRPNDLSSLKQVDWYGKLALIKSAQTANINQFVFCSLMNLEKFSYIPLMQMKKGIETKLEQSTIPYTIFRLSGFYQGLIGQYAIPILENQPIWITNENTCVSYMDTQDIAKFCLKSLSLPETKNQTFALSGIKGWVSSEIINLCEQLAGQKAEVSKIPILLLKIARQFLSFFQWGESITDRLAFVEILNVEDNFTKSTDNIYGLFKIKPEDLLSLEDYFQEYFIKILKRLKDINFEDVQKQKNLIL